MGLFARGLGGDANGRGLPFYITLLDSGAGGELLLQMMGRDNASRCVCFCTVAGSLLADCS